MLVQRKPIIGGALTLAAVFVLHFISRFEATRPKRPGGDGKETDHRHDQRKDYKHIGKVGIEGHHAYTPFTFTFNIYNVNKNESESTIHFAQIQFTVFKSSDTLDSIV